MKKPHKIIIDIILFLLILLWVYTASSKLLNFAHFKVQMNIQALPAWLSQLLVYILPFTELAAAALLLFKKTQYAGLWLSAVLMFLFTGYVGLIVINYFGRVPCSCGGVLRQMGWKLHFFFNLCYLLLTVTGIYIVYRERRVDRQ